MVLLFNKIIYFFLSVQSQTLLAHPHLWVRLEASKFLGFILSALDTKRVEHLLKNPDDAPESGYIYSDPVNTLRSLTLDLIAQLYPDMTLEELSDEIVKNLAFIARLLQSLDVESVKIGESQNVPNETDKNNMFSFYWMVKKMRKIVNLEVTQSPKSTSVVST